MGKLVVKIVNCRGLGGGDVFSKVDPYVKLTLGSKTFRTKAIDNDENPNYNEVFSFFVSDAGIDETLRLEIYDAGTFSDTLLGTAAVELSRMPRGQNTPLVLKWEKVNGHVAIEVMADYGVQQQQQSAPQGQQQQPQPMMAAPQPVMMQQPQQQQMMQQMPGPYGPSPYANMAPQPQMMMPQQQQMPFGPSPYANMAPQPQMAMPFGANPYANMAPRPQTMMPPQQQMPFFGGAPAPGSPFGASIPTPQSPQHQQQHFGGFAPAAPGYGAPPPPQQQHSHIGFTNPASNPYATTAYPAGGLGGSLSSTGGSSTDYLQTSYGSGGGFGGGAPAQHHAASTGYPDAPTVSPGSPAGYGAPPGGFGVGHPVGGYY